MALSDTIIDDVGNSNFKTVAGRVAQLAVLGAENAASNQQAMNQVQVGMSQIFAAGVGRIIRTQTELDPEEAASAAKVGNTLSSISGDLANAVGLLQSIAAK